MARKPYKPTDKHIETVRALKEKGATDAQCADAIGIGLRTFQKHKNAVFAHSIKKGNEDRINTHLELAQDALALRLQQRTVKELTTINKTIGGEDYTETKEVEKTIQPSDTLIMFTLVNRSDGEWKSINKADVIDPRSVQVPKIEIEVVRSDSPKNTDK
jgi:hypothetical protein